MATSVAMTTFGALAILEQRLTIGALIAANMLSGRLIGPLNQLVTNWRTYAAFAQAARRLGNAFALPGERTESVLELGARAGGSPSRTPPLPIRVPPIRCCAVSASICQPLACMA